MKHIALFAVALLSGCATATAISADISKACGEALPIINDAAPLAATNTIAATTTASVQAACTANGMVQMTLNDAAPVTATNSGNSPAWVRSSALFVQAAAEIVKANSAPVSK